jgi:hypothetical protein
MAASDRRSPPPLSWPLPEENPVNYSRMALYVVAALLVALLAGYLWGSSGRRSAEQAIDASRLRADLLEIRGSIVDARVDLYNVNFGNASRDLQEALDRLPSVADRLKSEGTTQDQQAIAEASAKAEEAHRLAGKLDAGANSRAAEAAVALDRVLSHTAR